MKEIELKGIDQKIYTEELENGLKVILIPILNKKDYYVNYTTKYGSINLNFIPNNSDKVYFSPKGIAHFLEHKMFEQKNGEDPFTFFSKSGTSSNAGTSYKNTSYYIYGMNSLKENLDYLINFVNEPFFTDKNVEKEKGIIIEEIKMYDDNPDWILSEEIAKATFKTHPIRYDIAGYPDTVNSITKEDLYTCYEAFYSPNNMILVVSGKFDKDDIIETIKSNKVLNSRCKNKDVKQVFEKETVKVNKKYNEINLNNVGVSKIAINFKLSLNGIDDKYNFYLYVMSLVNILFGESSEFKDKMLEKGYATSIHCHQMLVDNFLIIDFYIEGEKYKELLKNIKDVLENMKITEEEFNRYKKVLIANYIMNSDNIQNLADSIINDYINYDKMIVNKIDIFNKLNFKEFIKIREELDFNNNSTVVLKNNN